MMRSIRVLLVDDEAPFTSVLAKRLTRRGLSVCTASDSGEAYTLLETGAYDVLVLDMQMPGVDGLQLFKAIRQRFGAVEVIFLSGKSGMEDMVQSFNAGAFDYLRKGTSIEILERRIRDAAHGFLDRKTQWKAPLSV